MKKSEVKENIEKNSRSYWENQINEWIFNKTDREILTRCLLDDETLDYIAKDKNMDYTNLFRRYKKAVRQLLKHSDI